MAIIRFLTGRAEPDRLTISSVFKKIPNPARKWWAFWRPKMVATNELQIFRVIKEVTSE